METARTSDSASTRRELAILGAVTAVALVARLVALGSESLWYDEAVTLGLAKAPLLDIVTGSARDRGNPFGYWAVVHLWGELFGHSIESARALSAVAGAAAVPATWWLARRLELGASETRLAAVLVALSPPLVYLSREARVFALFATVTVVFGGAAVQVLKRRDLRAWALLVVSGIALVYLHYYAFLILAVTGVYLLWRLRTAGTRAIVELVASFAVIGLAFVPWLPVFLDQLGQGAERSADSWIKHAAFLPVYVLAGRTLVWKQQAMWMIGAVSLAAVACVLMPVAWWLWRRGRGAAERPPLGVAIALAVVLPALVVGISAVGPPLMNTRYLIVIVPFALVLISVGLVAGYRSQRLVAVASAVVLVALTCGSLARTYAVAHKRPWSDVAAHIHDTGGPADVYFYEDIGATPFDYYNADHRALHRIATPFGGDGSAWLGAGGVVGDMSCHAGGVWFVLLASEGPTFEERPAIERLLSEQFQLRDRRELSDLVVYQLAPSRPPGPECPR